MPMLTRLRRRLNLRTWRRRSAPEKDEDQSTISSKPPKHVLIQKSSTDDGASSAVSPVSVFDVESFHQSGRDVDSSENSVKHGTPKRTTSTPHVRNPPPSNSPHVHDDDDDDVSQASSIISHMESEPRVFCRTHVSMFDQPSIRTEQAWTVGTTSTVSTTPSATLGNRRPLEQIDENLPPTPSTAIHTLKQNLYDSTFSPNVFAPASTRVGSRPARSPPSEMTPAGDDGDAVSAGEQQTTWTESPIPLRKSFITNIKGSTSEIGEPRHNPNEVKSVLSNSHEVTVPSPPPSILAAPLQLESGGEPIAVSSTHLPGQRRVLIIGGADVGSKGTVIGWKRKGTLEIRLDDGRTVGKLVRSVNYLEEEEEERPEATEVENETPTSVSLIPQTERSIKEKKGTAPVASKEFNAQQTVHVPDHARQPNYSEPTDLSRTDHIGQKVRITTKDHKNEMAEIVKIKGKKTFEVRLLSTGKVLTKRVTSLEFCQEKFAKAFLEPVIHFNTTTIPPNIATEATAAATSVDVRGFVEETHSDLKRRGGVLASRSTTGNQTTPRVVTRSGALVTPLQSSSPATAESHPISGSVFGPRRPTRDDNGSGRSDRTARTTRSQRIFNRFRPASMGDTLRVGNRNVVQIVLSDDTESKPKEITFLSHFLVGRMLRVKIKMARTQKCFDKNIIFDGNRYELVSVKIDEDKESSWKFGRPQAATLIYADISDCDDGTGFKVANFLLQFGDFSVLDARKIAARLDLLQSPARFPIQIVNAFDFCDINEHGNVGCGFVEQEYLRKLCQKGGMTKSAAALVSAIQVRLFIPSKGIFKGVLQRKKILSGPPIQLPPSMKKVPASPFSDHYDHAFILVCQAGVHPSPGGANDYIGRKLDPSRKPPPEKSFTAAIKKPLSDMVLDLWKSLKVPSREILKYKKESVKPERRNHAWVVGVADPTGSLPPGRIFIPGMGASQPAQLFVTRSPCLKHDDARLLKTVNHKPGQMTQEQWDELQSLPFGSIVFSNPEQDFMSMPERIACGDLDGDLYLICWDEIIVSHMTDVEPMPDLRMVDDGVLKVKDRPNPNWLEEAHEIMTQAGFTNEMGRLVGALYKLSEKIAKSSPYFKRDPDAISLATAYNDALEFRKHGNTIQVPRHLQKDLAKNLHHLVSFI